jgi:hypothetical protein
MTRIALATISDDGRVDFDFSREQDARTLQKGLRLAAYPAGKMNAGKALERVHEEIFKTYTRSGVAQVCSDSREVPQLCHIKSSVTPTAK